MLLCDCICKIGYYFKEINNYLCLNARNIFSHFVDKFGIQEDQLLGFLDIEFQWLPIQKSRKHLTEYPNSQFS